MRNVQGARAHERLRGVLVLVPMKPRMALREYPEGTVNLSFPVTFSQPSTTSKSLIPSLGFGRFRPQTGRILLKLTVPYLTPM